MTTAVGVHSCKVCGAPLLRIGDEPVRHWRRRRYCSPECLRKHKKYPAPGRVRRACLHCGKEYWIPERIATAGQGRFCSVACNIRHRAFRPTQTFAGPTYRLVEYNGYYYASNHGAMHRAVWQFYHGPIPDGYVVHHKDGNRGNNAIDNLRLMTQSDHALLHTKDVRVSDVAFTCLYCGKEFLVNHSQAKYRVGFCSRKCGNLHRYRVRGETHSTQNSIVDVRRRDALRYAGVLADDDSKHLTLDRLTLAVDATNPRIEIVLRGALP